jgi:hypothetical protein
MTLGFIAKYDESGLAKKMQSSNAWCAWNKKTSASSSTST